MSKTKKNRITPSALLDPDRIPLTEAMKPAKTKAPRAKKEPKLLTPKVAKPRKERKVSCLDAAAQVLQEAKEPMAVKPIIEAIFAAKLWHSTAPTPHATLYSAILREINVKGTASRFTKTDRGHFAFNGTKGE